MREQSQNQNPTKKEVVGEIGFNRRDKAIKNFTSSCLFISFKGKEYLAREFTTLSNLNFLVSTLELQDAILADYDSEAVALDQQIVYFCTDEEIHLQDRQLAQLIWN